MKNLIYQFWDGNIRPSVTASVTNLKNYAERIGSEHIFEDNPNWVRSRGLDYGRYSPHFGALKPIYEEQFLEYDNILFCDADIFAVNDLKENIFDGFRHDIGICTEPFQPKQRQITTGRITSKQDDLWAKTVETEYEFNMPRTDEGLVKVYNSGVVLYSRNGMEKARKDWVSVSEYIKLIKSKPLEAFYMSDQPYIHTMMISTEMDVLEMDNGWNSYIHGTRDIYHPDRRIMDWRDESTKFVHCQFPGADNMTEDQLLRIVNNPRSEWDYDI